jgi:hypothetical protein
VHFLCDIQGFGDLARVIGLISWFRQSVIVELEGSRDIIANIHGAIIVVFAYERLKLGLLINFNVCSSRMAYGAL